METHECTEIGCADQASVLLRTDDGEWPDGDYTLHLAFDGVESSCSFAVPEDLPQIGSVGVLPCSGGDVMAYLNQEVMCVEYRDGDSVGQSCTPIPNQYYLSVHVYGTPASASVTLERDDEQLVEETLALTYEEARPNGPECEPLCRQASVEIDVPL